MSCTLRHALFMRILRRASLRANEILAVPGAARSLHLLAEDGLAPIQRFAQSACVEDQLVGVALGLGTMDDPLREPLITRLVHYFSAPVSRLATETLRHSVWQEGHCGHLPFAAARQEVSKLERQLAGNSRYRDIQLRLHATLCSDLWCDPRTHASPAARRVMLAMVPILAQRSHRFRNRSLPTG